jgi:hypothetical protein
VNLQTIQRPKRASSCLQLGFFTVYTLEGGAGLEEVVKLTERSLFVVPFAVTAKLATLVHSFTALARASIVCAGGQVGVHDVVFNKRKREGLQRRRPSRGVKSEQVAHEVHARGWSVLKPDPHGRAWLEWEGSD